MKRCLIFTVFLCTLFACQKEALDLTDTPPTENDPTTEPYRTPTTDQLEERSVGSNIIYSQHGRFAPFGEGSTWQYRTISNNYFIGGVGTGLAYSDTIDYTVETLDTVVIDQKEYIDMGGTLVRLQNGKYYRRYYGQDVQFMVEHPIVGMTWPNHRVMSITQTVTTSAGTFNNVVCVREGDRPATTHFYKAGVGYLGKSFSYSYQYYTTIDTDLMAYTIL